MTKALDQGPGDIVRRAELRAILIDEWSAVRYLHASSFERLAAPSLD